MSSGQNFQDPAKDRLGTGDLDDNDPKPGKHRMDEEAGFENVRVKFT